MASCVHNLKSFERDGKQTNEFLGQLTDLATCVKWDVVSVEEETCSLQGLLWLQKQVYQSVTVIPFSLLFGIGGSMSIPINFHEASLAW